MYKGTIGCFLILLLLVSCRAGTDNALAYFNRLTTIYRATEKKSKIYIDNKSSAPGSHEKAIIQRKMIQEIIYSIEETKQSHFNQDDFGFKKAILQDYYQSLKIIQDTSFSSWRKYESIDDQIKWLDSLSEALETNVARVRKQLLQCQQKFITYYKIPIQQPDAFRAGQ